jgi:hypothetical protein
MKIEQLILKGLVKKYLTLLNIEHLDEETLSKALQLIEDNLDGFFDWIQLSAPTAETNPDLFKILKETIIPDTETPTFKLDKSRIILFQQTFVDAKGLYLARDIQTTGLQEKYLKSQLTAKEPLTELDIKRFILKTDMEGKIQVTNLNDIGLILHSTHLQKQQQTEPYTVSMMINAGSEGEPPYPQWLSVVFTINPLANDVKYTVNAGYHLSEAQKDTLQNTLQTKIKDYFTETVTVESIVSHNLGKFNGYKALHALYQNASLVDAVVNNTVALDFSLINGEISALKQYIYALQLKSIYISPEQLEILNPQFAKNIENGIIKADVLDRHLGLLSTPIPSGASQHPLVVEQVTAFQLCRKKITFPEEKPTLPLTGIDYQQFLLQINHRFKQSDLKTSLDEMVMTCYDSAALEGLIAYNETKQPLPFQTLTLNFDGLELSTPELSEAFLFTLKTMLLSMSEGKLSTLKLIDPHQKLSEDMIKDLADFISERAVALDVLLPEAHQNSLMQRQIDEAVSDHIWQRNILALREVQAQSSSVLHREVRKRPKSKSKQSLSIDIELQEEMQVQVAVAASTEKASGIGALEESEAILFNPLEFQVTLEKGELDKSAKSYLVSSEQINASRLFCNWVGALTLIDGLQGLKLSKSACEELLRHHDKFQFGLDLTNLPAGFMLKTTEDSKSFIHFDENFKRLAPYNPLQIQTTNLPGVKALTSSQFKQWLDGVDDQNPIKAAWNTLNDAAYSREAHQLFKQFLPQLLSLNDAILRQLFTLCFKEDNSLDSKKFQFLMENAAQLKVLFAPSFNDKLFLKTLKDLGFAHPAIIAFIGQYEEKTPAWPNHLLCKLVADNQILLDKIQHLSREITPINLNALLQLYIQWGENGIDALTTMVNTNKVLFDELNAYVFTNNKTYALAISDEYKEAMVAIQGFTAEEKVWFKTLLQQHGSAQNDVNLPDLVNAFKAFNSALKELPTPDQKLLRFPDICEIKGVKSLPVALSRMLRLLKHCKECDRHAQWQLISKLDLSSTGMIKPISVQGSKQWAFITPEMRIINNEEFLSVETKYLAPGEWKNTLWGSGDETKESRAERFFRYVAFQEKNGQMPLEFYRYVNEKLEQSPLSDEVKRKFYSLLAGASTGIKTVAQISDLEVAKNEVDNLIKLINDTPLSNLACIAITSLPGQPPLPIIKEVLRNTLLDMLTAFDKLPPLPILNQLVSLISTSLHSNNPYAMQNNSQRLRATCLSLSELTQKYGSAIYQGMKDYKTADYAQENLFYTHLEVIKHIDEKFQNRLSDAKYLISVISLFKLTKQNLEPILEIDVATTNPESLGRRVEALSLLEYISIKAKPELRALNSDDLAAILKAVRDSAQPLPTIFKELTLSDGKKLETYFPADLLDNYAKKGIPEEVLAKMSEHFNEKERSQLSKLLLNFSVNDDRLHYGNVVDKIIKITERLNAIEKSIFIKKLSHALGLYTNRQLLSAEDNFFIKLLDICIARESVDELMNLIAAERHILHRSSVEQQTVFFVSDKDEQMIPNLSEKAVLYMQRLSPAISAIPDLAISAFELTRRLQETLLKTPAPQLRAKSAIISEKEVLFKAPQDAIAEVLLAFDSTENLIPLVTCAASLDAFIKAQAIDDARLLIDYKERLQQINETQVNEEDLAECFKNPIILLLFAYLILPESLPDVQRQFFEGLYKSKIEAMLNTYPAIVFNKDLITVLQKNPKFMQSLSKPEVLAAISSPELLDDDRKLDLVFKSLNEDIENLVKFKTQTVAVQKELSDKKLALSEYPNTFVELYKKINEIAKENPSCKTQFLELFDTYLNSYSPGSREQPVELLKYLADFVNPLEKSFAKIKDKNRVLSLCLQFNTEALKPHDLLALLSAVEELQEDKQELLLKIAVVLINNEKDYTTDTFIRLCALAKGNDALMGCLAAIYKNAPFPTIEKVMEWHDEAKDKDGYSPAMIDSYKDYNKAPCERELTTTDGKPRNGFHASIAKTKLEEFKGFEGNINLEAFEAITAEMRYKTTDELIDLLKTFNPSDATHNPDATEETLVAVAAELFHRSKGKTGNSMEINTTQYLSILTSLKTKGHVTHEIGTGEGKSRIMMISIACQHAQGKTVDFVTSDAQLATRDFVEYQAYFDLIGAESSMIFANTDFSSYKIGGINFSDPSNLSLFRNKARSVGKGDQVIDKGEQCRALLLDEADKTYFDVADTRFNYSKEADDSIRDMAWVYPLLMDYFEESKLDLETPIDDKMSISAIELYYEDIDLSREKFLQFANSRCNAKELMRLKALSNGQIDEWQVSAVTASQLTFKHDFVIEPDVLISTSKGPKISSEAQLLFGNRVSKQSKFSFGVHQFLHARLNLARKNLSKVKDEGLREALSACEQSFYVPDEKQIVYSSTSKNLLDDYKRGALKAVTGTSGSMMERQEARVLHGLASDTAEDNMHFIDVPRHQGMQRRDRAIRLTGNSHQQLKALVAQIKDARAKHQPILVIAENDEQSEILFKKLNRIFKENIQHIHSQLSSKAEKECTDRAGEPGQISISTDMIGRGTDISLKDRASENGLNVMVTYLPRDRDWAQIVGRSGRYGKRGESSLILDKQRLKKALGKTKLGDDYYKNVEAFIRHEQAVMDRRSQTQRLIKTTVNDFRKVLTIDFHEKMLNFTSQDDRKKLQPAWIKFFEQSDKAWNEKWPHIQTVLSQDSIDIDIDIDKIKRILGIYQKQVQKLWTTLRREVENTDVICTDTHTQKPIDKLLGQVPVLELTEAIKDILSKPLSREKALQAEPKVYENYDPGHEGRAVQYQHWSIPFFASLKGYANLLPFVNFPDARRPFANTRAWFEGHGQLFPNLRASPNKGKIIGASLLALIGAAVGFSLLFTGILAPLGISVLGVSSLITTAVFAGAAGMAAGALVGVAGGAVVDAIVKKKTTQLDVGVNSSVQGQGSYERIVGSTKTGQPQGQPQGSAPSNHYGSIIGSNTKLPESVDQVKKHRPK